MTKEELELIIEEEKNLYLGNNEKRMKKSQHKRYLIFMFLYNFRYCQYYKELRKNPELSKLKKRVLKYKYRYYEKKKNIFSYKSGVEIGINSNIGRCCDIWHGGVVINGNIGDNCVFHGNNIIGNKGLGKESQIPCIKNNVDIGAGANIIGNVYIAESCVIGAGAVVTKDCKDNNSILTGIPAKKVN